MEQKEQKFTWGDLKKFINEIPESELSKEVVWWGDERGGKIYSAFQLDEDHVKTEEGIEPLSVIEDGYEYGVTYKKGTPILGTD